MPVGDRLLSRRPRSVGVWGITLLVLMGIFTLLVLIPWTSISHFIPPLPVCLLADICNHTWIPECAQENDYDFRMFIDECDVTEYNCDYNRNYTVTNYSDCFRVGAITCPPMRTCAKCPTCKQCRLGNWVLIDGRRQLLDPIATVPMNQRRFRQPHEHGLHGDHNHFVEHIHLHNNYRGYGTLRDVFLPALEPDRTKGWRHSNRRRYNIQPGRKLGARTKETEKMTNITSKNSKKNQIMKIKKTTKQVIETATTDPRMLFSSKFTMRKGSKLFQKVVKYYRRSKSVPGWLASNVMSKNDSDFLEK